MQGAYLLLRHERPVNPVEPANNLKRYGDSQYPDKKYLPFGSKSARPRQTRKASTRAQTRRATPNEYIEYKGEMCGIQNTAVAAEPITDDEESTLYKSKIDSMHKYPCLACPV